jgi:hypothetical protein
MVTSTAGVPVSRGGTATVTTLTTTPGVGTLLLAGLGLVGLGLDILLFALVSIDPYIP